MSITLSGIITFVRFLQLRNNPFSILLILFGSVILERLVQLANASYLILNSCYAVWNCNFSETGAIIKGVISNTYNSIRN